jgi:hypothetical protein
MKIELFWSSIAISFLLISCTQQNQIKENYSLQVGSNKILIDEKEYLSNAPVIEVKGNVYIPLRFFAERFNVDNLQYDPKTEKITFSLFRPIAPYTLKTYESGNIKTSSEPSSSAPEASPVVSSEKINIGDDVFLDKPIVGRTKACFDEYIKYASAKDKIGYMSMIYADQVFLPEEGAKAKIIDSDIWNGRYQIRIMSGEYYGQTGWVMMGSCKK